MGRPALLALEWSQRDTQAHVDTEDFEALANTPFFRVALGEGVRLW